MTGIFMESIVMAFMIGAIVGAVTALHLSGSLALNKSTSEQNSPNELEEASVKVKNNNSARH